MKIRIHFNKRTKTSKVWTLITSKACFHAEIVHILTPVTTEFHPEKKRNPRAFMVTRGRLVEFHGIMTILPEANIFDEK